MITKERLTEIDSLPIHAGGHDNFDEGHCAMELVAWLAGEEHSDRPACTCLVLAAFVRSWNDGLPTDEDRARLLRPFLPRLVGTAGDEHTRERRAWMATDWLVRECAPAFLELNNATRDHAWKLRALGEITNGASAGDAQVTIRAAWGAAWGAAWDAAWDAARAAAWAAARAAAWDAARAAPRDAAGDALRPVVKQLQASASDLLDRMINAN